MKVALDIDDVLASFYPSLCKRMGVLEKKVNIWDGLNECRWVADSMPLVHNDIDFWMGLSVLSNPNSINFNVECYITSSPEHIVSIRAAWLESLGFPSRPVFSTHDKLKFMISKDIDVLVDDKISTIDLVNQYGKVGLQFKPPYMTQEIEDKSRVITHLSEVGQWLFDNSK